MSHERSVSCGAVLHVREDCAYLPAEDVEEHLIETVLEVLRDLVHPNNALARRDIDETEPVLLLEACPSAGAEFSVAPGGNAVTAEDHETSEAGVRP